MEVPMPQFKLGDIYRFPSDYTRGRGTNTKAYAAGDLREVKAFLHNGAIKMAGVYTDDEELFTEEELLELIDNDLLELFEEAGEVSTTHTPPFSEPKNNGTREFCYWCKKRTTPLGARTRYCEDCKK